MHASEKLEVLEEKQTLVSIKSLNSQEFQEEVDNFSIKRHEDDEKDILCASARSMRALVPQNSVQ